MQDRQDPGARRILPTLGAAFALAFATTALADDTTTPLTVTAAAPAGEPLLASQFIDKTYVNLPKRVGMYSLDKVKYEPEQLDAGIYAAYTLEDAPGHFTISLYVYPQGRTEEKLAAEAQIEEVERAIRQQPDYSKIEAGARTDFVVDAPEPSALPNDRNGRKQRILVSGPVKKAPADSSKEADQPSLSQALVESRAPTKSTGRRQGFAYQNKGGDVRSAGLVFYRNLYNIKLRISSPTSAMDQSMFDTLVDATARALVPKVDIRNFGQCGQMIVVMEDTGDKDRDALAHAVTMLQEQGRVARENCAEGEGDKPDPVDEAYERIEIVFPPGIWRQSAD